MPPRHADWKYFRKDARGPANKPYVDIFTADHEEPVFHGKDITINRVWLAFKCPEFAAQRPEERIEVALGLDPDTISRESHAVRQEYAQLRAARAARLAQVGPGAVVAAIAAVVQGEGEGEDEGGGSVTSIFVHGSAVMKQSSLMNHVQRMAPQDIETARRLLFRWLVTANLPLSVFDSPEWLDFLNFVAPAFAQFSINRAYIRCVCARVVHATPTRAVGWRGARRDAARGAQCATPLLRAQARAFAAGGAG
jgi:hypothetical protein